MRCFCHFHHPTLFALISELYHYPKMITGKLIAYSEFHSISLITKTRKTTWHFLRVCCAAVVVKASGENMDLN